MLRTNILHYSDIAIIIYNILAHEIKIYGDIVPFQDSWIVESGMCNLSHVQNQLREANGEDVKVRINSWGGDVDEGFAIYAELRRYAKENNAMVETFAEGRCASIATVFFLAGDKRVLSEYLEPFVHNAWTYAVGDAKTLTRVSADLEKCNERIANHYALHTDLTYEEARELMDAETSISPKEALNIRFATDIEEILRPVALQRFNNNKHKPINNMSDNKEKGLLNQILALVKGSEKQTLQNKVVFTAEQKEVDFYELGEDDEVKVGDKATIDGQPAEGEHTMADGKKYTFSGGTLNEIEEKEQGDENAQQIADLEAQIEALKASNSELESKYNSVKSDLDAKNAVIESIKALESKFEAKKTEVPKKEVEQNKVSESVNTFRERMKNQSKKK